MELRDEECNNLDSKPTSTDYFVLPSECLSVLLIYFCFSFQEFY